MRIAWAGILLGISSLVVSCSPKKTQSIDRVQAEASAEVKRVIETTKQQSTGYTFLRSLPSEQIENFKFSSITKPELSTRLVPSFQERDFKNVWKISSDFNTNTSKPRTAFCVPYNDPPDPNDSALLATDYYTTPTAAVVQIANELGNYSNIFSYVQNEIKNGLLFGATQSADMLLKSRSGSDVDKANLLAALLRIKKIPVQFVLGEISLSTERAKRYFNVATISDVFLTLYYMFRSFFEYNSELGSQYFQTINGVNYVQVPHVWVRAFENGQWTNLDPTQLSDPLLPSRATSIIGASTQVNWSNWFFGTDYNGNYIKPETVIDFLLESNTVGDPITFINGQSSYSGSSYTNNVLTEQPECVISTNIGLQNSNLEFRGEIILDNHGTNTQVLKVNEPLAMISENPSYISHSAGLLSDVGSSSPGNMQFTIGKNVMAQYSTTTGTAYDVTLNVYMPAAFSNTILTRQEAHSYVAGDVFEANLFARPTNQIEMLSAIDQLKSDVEIAASHTAQMADVHRLAGLMFRYRISNQLNDEETLRGVKFFPVGMYGTYSTDGAILSNQTSREFGIIPTYAGIDAFDYVYPLAGTDYDADSYYGFVQNLGLALQESVVAGSDSEADIWEQLFGVRGFSAVRGLQQAAYQNATYSGSSSYTFTLIEGTQFDSTTSNAIASQLDTSSALYAQWPGILNNVVNPLTGEKNGSPGHYFWGPNKSVVDYASPHHSIVAYVVLADPFLTNDAYFSFNADGTELKNAQIDAKGGSTESYNSGSVVDGLDLGILSFKPQGGGEEDDPLPPETPDDGLGTTGPGDNADISTENGQPGQLASCNPVEYTTGRMWHNFVDFNLRGHTPNTGLFFQRTYYTLPQYQDSTKWVANGDFGKGWTHNFDMRLLDGSMSSSSLSMSSLNSSTSNVLLITEKGNPILFSSSSSSLVPPAGFNATLTSASSSYVLTMPGNVQYVFQKNLTSNYNGRLIQVNDPHGESLTVAYDSNGRLQTVTSPYAGTLSITRDGNNRIASIYNSKNNLTTNYSVVGSNLTYSTDYDGRKTSYAYNSAQSSWPANGLLSSFTDPLNRTISFAYYENGKVEKEIGLGGAVQAYQYAANANQNYTRVMGADGNTYEYRYDSNFRAVLDVRPDGSRIQRKWTSAGEVQWERDGFGNETDYTYDTRGNRTGIKKPLWSSYAQVTYDQTYDKPTLVSPLAGSPTQITLNTSGDVTSINRNYVTNFSINYTYDTFGNRLQTQTNLGTMTDLTDTDGLYKFKFQARNPITIKNDARRRIVQEQFANGRILDFAYDKYDRVTSSMDSAGPGFRNYYDAMGRMIKQDRVSGTTVQTAYFTYDDRDRLTSSTNYNGEKTEFKYDIVGVGCLVQDKPAQIIRPDGTVTKFEYDVMGRTSKELRADGSYVLYGYNLRGDLSSVLDSVGNLMQFSYDANRRLAETLNQSAGWQTNTYGAKIGFMPEMTTYNYDQADRLVSKQQILNDELLQNGMYLTNYVYDPLDRVIQKTQSHVQGSSVIELFDQVNYVYDPQLAPNQLAQVSNLYVTLNFKHETVPPYRLLSYSQTPSAAGAVLGIESHSFVIKPDTVGPIAGITRDALGFLSEAYDPAGRLLSASATYNGTSNAVTMTYDNTGRRTGISNSTGLAGSFGYDNADRLNAITWTASSSTVMSENLTYTSAGIISQTAREFGTFNYSYNPIYEVSSISYSGSSSLSSSYVNTTLTYDQAGNPLSYHGATYQSFNNFVTQIGTSNYIPSSDGLGRLMNRWDASGNLQDLRYYPEGQLEKYRIFNTSGILQSQTNFYYDGLGRRIAKVTTIPGGSTTNIDYTYLGEQNKILFGKYSNAASSVSNEALYVDGQGVDEHLFEISQGGGVKAFQIDHLGSVINSAAIGGVAVYGLFGENIGTPLTSNSANEPALYGYAGRELDTENGLYYMRRRYYDPAQGRFITKDPIGLLGGTNPYQYAFNNPLLLVDPLGLDGEQCGGGSGGAASQNAPSGNSNVTSQDTVFVAPNGQATLMPAGTTIDPAANGNGTVFVPPDSESGSGVVRLMGPADGSEYGYGKIQGTGSQSGQYLDANGIPQVNGAAPDAHIQPTAPTSQVPWGNGPPGPNEPVPEGGGGKPDWIR